MNSNSSWNKIILLWFWMNFNFFYYLDQNPTIVCGSYLSAFRWYNRQWYVVQTVYLNLKVPCIVRPLCRLSGLKLLHIYRTIYVRSYSNAQDCFLLYSGKCAFSCCPVSLEIYQWHLLMNSDNHQEVWVVTVKDVPSKVRPF